MRIRLLLIIGILLTAGILYTILPLNSTVARASDAIYSSAVDSSMQDHVLNENAASDAKNRVIEKKLENEKRKAAGKRLKAAREAARLALPAGMDPGGLPHYYGPYPNYANSPMPKFTTVTNPTTVGNQLIDRAYASDFPVAVGQLAPVFVVVPSAVLPAGTLLNFQTWNQATNGGSPFPSAGNIFYAYVLRPTGIPNQYTVVFNSSQFTVPSLTTPGISEIATFPVLTPFTVQAGDVIGFYGQGIPIDTGTGTDILSYPAPTPPADGSTITLGVDAGFPILERRNYAIAATVGVSTTTLTGGIRKFVDSLPGLNAAGANNLGQYMPIAIPDTTTYPGSDYYEIELGEYSEKMHSDLPPTTLRGYRQINTADPNVSKFHYLGPLIIAKRGTPVRINFTNKLPTGAGGDLFLPVDTTIMGAGPFMTEDPANPGNMISGNFTQNRATLHLHGGFVPWISDGTPHQWITPAGETTAYPKGVSVYNVPDMPDPGDGSMTFYYNNDQSARLQFYHDHSFGITRLNVYAGEAAGYLVTDQVEQDMIAGTNISGVNPDGLNILPDVGIPLIIQDRTFVDNSTIDAQDPTWNWGTGPRDANGKITGANTGDLWLPHVYMPNQNPSDPSGMNAFGRWHYSPWFFPAPTDIVNGPIPNPYCLPTPGVNCSETPLEHTHIPAVPNPSFAMEAFMDTPIVNGAAYPNLTVEPKAYRFRILNAANDRFLNLQMYVADPSVTTHDGRASTEVKMVPAVATTGFPADWPIDGREGGVPDPATAGPSFIQIGTEGGFLPAPVVLPNQPVDWNMDQTNFDMGVVNKGTLILGTAERADVIVDFSAFAGKTIILYNDAPAPFPAIDARYDYYTGNPDLRDIGGAPSTLAGYGPNTRTIMQIKVNNTAPAATYSLTALQAVFAKTAGKRGVFESSQDEIIVQQKAYETAYDKVYPSDKLVGINDKSKTFLTALGTPMTIQFNAKAIQDETSETYSVEDGRMSAMLGLTKPGIPGFIPFPYLSPPVEIVKDSVYGTPLGSLGDGTQIWKITHNGVDTHTIHVHLFNAQLINRVAWDNAYRPADLNEVGWKETIRVNPLQDTIIALRPVAPTLPFGVPNSIRPIDPTMPVDSPLKPPPLGWKDANGNPVTVLNRLVNFGWEYVYHCHLLGHEEMDMMHDVSLAVKPKAPYGLAATVGSPVTLTWTDNSTDEIVFTVQRATNDSFTANLTAFTVPGSANGEFGGTMTFTDWTDAGETMYYYRVLASNVVGDTTMYQLPATGFPTMIVDSEPSNTVLVTTPLSTIAAPTNLQGRIIANPTRIRLTWTDASNNETSFVVWRSDNGGAYTQIGTIARTAAQTTATGGSVIFDNTNTPTAPLVAGHTYKYFVTAVNAVDASPSNTVMVVFSAPLAPANLNGRIIANPARISINWTDASDNEISFAVWRSDNNGPYTQISTVTRTVAQTMATGGNVIFTNSNTLAAPLVAGHTYRYYVRAVNPLGSSSPSNTVTVVFSAPVAPTALNGSAVVISATLDRVTLTWTDNSNNENNFQIQRALGIDTGFNVSTNYIVGANVISFSQNVSRANNYNYRVRAGNPVGNSSWSNVVLVTTP